MAGRAGLLIRWKTGWGVMKSCRSLFGWSWGNKEKRTERRKNLKTELERGYFFELQEFYKNRGKRFHAECNLLSSDRAIRFPAISGYVLSGEPLSLPFHQTSLILVSMKKIGMIMCDQYRKPFEAEFKGRIPVVELSILEQRLLVFFQHWIKRNLMKSVSPSRHGSFMLYSGDREVSDLREAIDLHNSIVGHAYLLDKKGLIRWRAHATPTASEIQIMLKCSRQLLEK